MTHTHNLTQWAQVHGRQVICFVRARPNTNTRMLIALKPLWFKSKADAESFKRKFDA